MYKILILLILVLMTGSCSNRYGSLASFGPGAVVMDNGLGLDNGSRANFWSAVKPLSSLPESHYRLGRYYQKSGNHQLAIEEFIKAIKLDKRYVLAYNGLGMSYDALKDCVKAQEAYSNALLYRPDTAYIYNNLGYSRLLCNDFEHAVWFFTKAAKLDETSTRIRNNLTLAQLRFQHQAPEKILLSKIPPPADPVREEKLSDPVEPPQPATPVKTEETAEKVQAPIGNPIPPALHLQALATVSPPEANNHTDIAPEPASLAVTGKSIARGQEANVLPAGIKKAAAIVSIAPDKVKKQPIEPAAPDAIKEDQGFSFCKIEVSNGNGISGMAGRSAEYFKSLGFTVGRITNAASFTFASSKIYYKEGYLGIAKAVAWLVPGPQEFEQVEDLGRLGIGVRLLLGRDMAAIRFQENLSRKTGVQETRETLLAMTADYR